LIGRWVWVTSLGWFAGFVLIVALAMLWDLVGGGAEFMVGVGMGAGVGLVQGFFLRRWIGSPVRWTVATTTGVGILFVAHDLLSALGFDAPYSLPLYMVASALLVSLLQRSLLASVSSRSSLWIPVSFVGWSVPAGLIALGDAAGLPAPLPTVCSLAGMFLGGTILGVVTGPAVAAILGPRPSGAGDP